MRFIVTDAHHVSLSKPPVKGAVKEKVPDWDHRTFKSEEAYNRRFSHGPPWRSEGINHSFYYYSDGKVRGIRRQRGMKWAWVVEATSVAELIEIIGIDFSIIYPLANDELFEVQIL